MEDFEVPLQNHIDKQNSSIALFTPGPGSLLLENILPIKPCFGRNDAAYEAAEGEVLNHLKRITGHAKIIRMQGSASLALEVAIENFIFGKVLLIHTGYYSDRLRSMIAAKCSRTDSKIELTDIGWGELDSVSGNFDWIVGCHVETSIGLKVPIDVIRRAADRTNAKLMLDATASVGLESRQELADVIAYSSCKGLFGLTGAAFISSHILPTVEVSSFYLNYATHLQKCMTGPYHTILSLLDILPKHAEIRESVAINKEVFGNAFAANIPLAPHLQPLLCTYVNRRVISTAKNAIMYESRLNTEGSIVCHLGELHLGASAKGSITNSLELV
jgi:aspartate aminotransferase-like enzyme